MFQSIIDDPVQGSTPHAGLAVLGVKLQQLDLFGPIRRLVQIAQKTVQHAPTDKLYDAFIAILAGAHGVVDLNRLVRADPALQAAFGRAACAEQSVVQDTFNACTNANVAELETALDAIYRQHGRGYRHDYAAAYQLLDADMSGLPCGKKAAAATKGYFAKQRNRRGRQLGRIIATHYGEILRDRVFAGTVQLNSALPELVTAAATTLELDAARRSRTIVRVDAGGGSVADVNWVLAQGYQFHGKDYSTVRARDAAQSVTEWVVDPKVAGREVGWVRQEPTAYERPVVRVAVRCRKKNGQWGHATVLSSLDVATVVALVDTLPSELDAATAALLAYVYFYDGRGGGVETTLKEDKQGLAVGQRNKKRLAAQQMLVGLSALAHNVLVWARAWLAPQAPSVAGYGVKRWVRDVLGICGQVGWDHQRHLLWIILNQADRLAHKLVAAFQDLVGPEHVVVCLGQT